jgi:hypothetical protein
MGVWSVYAVDGGKADLGITAWMTLTILPVAGEMAIVAGVRMRVSSGRVRTALVEVRTTSGPPAGVL